MVWLEPTDSTETPNEWSDGIWAGGAFAIDEGL
jgi:hypothetical protein